MARRRVLLLLLLRVCANQAKRHRDRPWNACVVCVRVVMGGLVRLLMSVRSTQVEIFPTQAYSPIAHRLKAEREKAAAAAAKAHREAEIEENKRKRREEAKRRMEARRPVA